MERILHISKYYYPFVGGVEQVAKDYITTLKGNYEQKVICFNHEKGTKVDFVDEIEVTRVGCFLKLASQSLSLSYNHTLKRLLEEYKPTIVLFHYPNPFVSHFLLKYRKHGFKLVVLWHLDITKQKIIGRFFHKQTTKLLDFADRVIATSPNYIEGSPYLSKYRKKCVVIPCSVDEERLKYSEENIERATALKKRYLDKTICFAFGRHVEYKGLTYLIQASKLLDDNYVIMIGGNGPLTKSLMKEASTDKKIIFLGRLSDEDLKTYLLACNIFCFPSITKNEAFGIGLLEAMFYKKPVAVFNIHGSGVNYVVKQNETGIEVQNRNVLEYSEAIRKLSDFTLQTKMGTEGYIRYLKMFSQEQFKSKVLSFFNEGGKYD